MRNVTDMFNALLQGYTLVARGDAEDVIAFSDGQFLSSQGEPVVLAPSAYRVQTRMDTTNDIVHWAAEVFALDMHDPYWTSLNAEAPFPYYWGGTEQDEMNLLNRVVHRTQEKAKLHATAMRTHHA
jgi:hypothetical protein